MPTTGDAKHKITVRKGEETSEITIIDTVSSSPFNGWIEQRVSFNSLKAGYNVKCSSHSFIHFSIILSICRLPSI